MGGKFIVLALIVIISNGCNGCKMIHETQEVVKREADDMSADNSGDTNLDEEMETAYQLRKNPLQHPTKVMTHTMMTTMKKGGKQIMRRQANEEIIQNIEGNADQTRAGLSDLANPAASGGQLLPSSSSSESGNKVIIGAFQAMVMPMSNVAQFGSMFSGQMPNLAGGFPSLPGSGGGGLPSLPGSGGQSGGGLPSFPGTSQ